MQFLSVILITLLILLSSVIAFADSTYVDPGPVFGNWTVDNSPYIVHEGDIYIEEGSSLNIEPGVVVKFYDEVKMIIYGRLNADGTEEDSIKFTRRYPYNLTWGGLKFVEAYEGCSISYCIIEYCDRDNAYGSLNGGGIFLDSCAFNISHCTIAHNTSLNGDIGGNGGGICLILPLGTVIEYCHIFDNESGAGGGISSGGYGDLIIRYNIIEDNYASYYGGGVVVDGYAPAYIHDNIVRNNSCDHDEYGGGGICLWTSYELTLGIHTIYNNLIYGNYSLKGGGIFSRFDASIIYNNTIADNIAYEVGGGIFIINYGNFLPDFHKTIFPLKDRCTLN